MIPESGWVARRTKHPVFTQDLGKCKENKGKQIYGQNLHAISFIRGGSMIKILWVQL